MSQEQKPQKNIGTDAKTENGARAFSTTLVSVLDLFFKTVRGLTDENLKDLMEKAWKESPLDVLKLLFYCRDCRGGKGERKLFKQMVKWLVETGKANHVRANLKLVSEFGRWDDLLEFANDKEIGEAVCKMIADQLEEDLKNMMNGKPVSLCAKWAPTENKKADKKVKCVKLICNNLKCNKATYRKKYLTPLRSYLKVVECYMSTNQWEKIKFDAVPSQAMKKLKKAFEKHQGERWAKYLESLKKGEAKVNSSVLEPYELVQKYYNGEKQNVISEEQWKGITERVQKLGSMENCCVLSDVSGSMSGEPMIVSIALGILISSLQKGPFQNRVLTFESRPQWVKINGSLCNKVKQLKAAPWGGTTRLDLAINKLLDLAKGQSVPCPEKLFVISDMQFNQADNAFMTNLESLKLKFEKEGFKIPQIVFWNVRSNTKSVPAEGAEDLVAMIGGYSSSLLKAVMEGEDFTPYGIMRKALDDKRYDCIKLDGDDMDEEEEDDFE